MQTPNFAQQTLNLDYVAILRGIWRRHKRLVFITFVAVAGPLLVVLYATRQPIYVSKATVSIEPSAVALAQIPFTRETPAKSTLASHMVLLKSRSLAAAVIDSLPQESSTELLTAAQYTDYWLLLTNTVYGWMGKPPVVLSPREQALTEIRMARMEFEASREAENVYTISATASRARAALDLVNTYIQVLLNRTRTVEREDTKRTREFLELQYQQTKDALARDEQAFAKFQQRTGRTRSVSQDDFDASRLVQLDTTLKETQANREVLSNRIETLRKTLEEARSKEASAKKASDLAAEDAKRLSVQNQARINAFKAAQERLDKLEAKLSSLQERFTENHPVVRVTKDEITEQEARVAQLARQLPSTPPPAPPSSDPSEMQAQLISLEKELDALRIREQTLTIQMTRLRPSLQTLGEVDIEFSRLNRAVEAKRNLLSVFADKLVALNVRDQVEPSIIRIVDPASLPIQTTDKKTYRFALMILGLAGSIAFGMAFGVESLRQPVETESDAATATGLPILGSVDVMENLTASQSKRSEKRPLLLPVKPERVTTAQLRPVHVELYRAIRANIETQRIKSPFHSILVTSAGPGEGKSTTILNLAQVFQEFGRRVLVIDGDLRRPALAAPLALTNRPGVVDFLRGTATFDEVCRHVLSGIAVVPGQIARGDAGTLLASPRFKELLEIARKQFDLILLDSAPLLAVPDSLLVTHFVERVILVVKAKTTSIRDLRKVQAVAERNAARILGVILNQADRRDVPYYHPRYRKYYASTDGKGSQGASNRLQASPGRDEKKVDRYPVGPEKEKRL
jgi:polysaccharide biosynthesis transport protein